VIGAAIRNLRRTELEVVFGHGQSSELHRDENNVAPAVPWTVGGKLNPGTE